jgi:hypothetical protein
VVRRVSLKQHAGLGYFSAGRIFAGQHVGASRCQVRGTLGESDFKQAQLRGLWSLCSATAYLQTTQETAVTAPQWPLLLVFWCPRSPVANGPALPEALQTSSSSNLLVHHVRNFFSSSTHLPSSSPFLFSLEGCQSRALICRCHLGDCLVVIHKEIATLSLVISIQSLHRAFDLWSSRPDPCPS